MACFIIFDVKIGGFTKLPVHVFLSMLPMRVCVSTYVSYLRMLCVPLKTTVQKKSQIVGHKTATIAPPFHFYNLGPYICVLSIQQATPGHSYGQARVILNQTQPLICCQITTSLLLASATKQPFLRSASHYAASISYGKQLIRIDWASCSLSY